MDYSSDKKKQEKIRVITSSFNDRGQAAILDRSAEISWSEIWYFIIKEIIKTRKFRDKKNISYKKLSVEQALKTETLGKPSNLASELLHGKKKVRNY